MSFIVLFARRNPLGFQCCFLSSSYPFCLLYLAYSISAFLFISPSFPRDLRLSHPHTPSSPFLPLSSFSSAGVVRVTVRFPCVNERDVRPPLSWVLAL